MGMSGLSFVVIPQRGRYSIAVYQNDVLIGISKKTYPSGEAGTSEMRTALEHLHKANELMQVARAASTLNREVKTFRT